MSTKGSSLCLLLVAAVTVSQLGCNNTDQRPRKPVNPDHVYFDYRVWGDEERNTVTITLQFRQTDMNGDPFALEHPAKVVFDDEELIADSSKMNGVYYELNRTVKEFEGDHTIVYTDTHGKQFREVFHFSIMELMTSVPSTWKRKDLVFELKGLDTSDFVHVIMTDTSFYSRGIDRVDTVRDGRVIISETDLDNVKNGPVFLEFYREESWPLKETTPAGGRLNMSYSLKRAFELGDPAR